MFSNLLQPVIQTYKTPQNAGFQVHMSKSAVLETPFFNIPDWKLITREEMSEIRYTFADFSIPFLRKGTPPKVLLFPTSDLLCAPECAPALRY